MINKHGFSKWLDITEQQAVIVNIIYNLQQRKSPTNPVNIEKEYIKETNTFIQKSNLFSQLKILQEKKIIIKSEQSKYAISMEGIREIILSKKKELSKRLDEINSFTSETETFLQKIAQPTNVYVTYLTESDIYKKLSFYLQNASSFYLGCDFPHYAYSFSLCRNSQQTAYIETLNKRLLDKNFYLFCLCTYKTDAITYQLSEKYSNKEFIREELQQTHLNAIEKTARFSNIDLRKSKTPFDFALIEDKEGSSSLFMFIKDSNSTITGGIFINSNETIKQIKQHFLSEMSNCPPLKSKEDFPIISLEILSKGKKKKLIAFDVNQIFTRNHTTVELAKQVGKSYQVANLITKQIEGTLSIQEAIEQSAKLLEGLSIDKVHKLCKEIPLMKNLNKGIQKLKEKEYHIVAISTGFSHVIVPICKSLGIDEVYCNVLEEKDGKLTGFVLEKNVVTDNVKYYIVKYLLERYSIPEENSVGVGDGYSDLDMLKATKLRIAFNPTNKLIKMFEQKTPLINLLIKEKDFMILTKKILENS